MNRFVKIIGPLILCIAALIFNIKGEINVQSQSDTIAHDQSFLYESKTTAELLEFTNSFTNFIQPSNHISFTSTLRLLKTKLDSSFYQFTQAISLSNNTIQFYDVKESKSILFLQSNDYYVYLLRRIII